MALIPLVILLGCGKSEPVSTTLQSLGNAQRQFDGRVIEVHGTLRTFDDPRHYWIEDADLNRVALEYADLSPSMAGQEVIVSGTFRYTPDEGRLIRVKSLTLP